MIAQIGMLECFSKIANGGLMLESFCFAICLLHLCNKQSGKGHFYGIHKLRQKAFFLEKGSIDKLKAPSLYSVPLKRITVCRSLLTYKKYFHCSQTLA